MISDVSISEVSSVDDACNTMASLRRVVVWSPDGRDEEIRGVGDAQQRKSFGRGTEALLHMPARASGIM